MNGEQLANGRVTLFAGDCLDVLAAMAENSVDSVVTDPPYHLTEIKTSQQSFASQMANGRTKEQKVARGFMGKSWDGGDIAFNPETWAVVYRVLKPGGYLLAFGGTRTYHRLACAVEDAGFEIRDSISYLHASGPLLWVYGSGFPKSLNVSKALNGSRCLCDVSNTPSVSSAVPQRTVLQSEVCGHSKENTAEATNLRGLQYCLDSAKPVSGSAQQDLLAEMRSNSDIAQSRGFGSGSQDAMRILRNDDVQSAMSHQTKHGDLLQQFMPEQDVRGEAEAICGEWQGQAPPGNGDGWPPESGMEGRGDVSASPRQLCKREIRPMSARDDFDGTQRRICDGASVGNGSLDWTPAFKSGMCSSSRSQSTEQSTSESGTVAMQSQPQAGGAWPHCRRCGKPIIPDGLGTALKPATEIIVVARKPLSESTVAGNVLRWGTGAINIDGCRVHADDAQEGRLRHGGGDYTPVPDNDPACRTFGRLRPDVTPSSPAGRWPANCVHDGSEEVVAAFPDAKSAGEYTKSLNDPESYKNWLGNKIGPNKRTNNFANENGSAARFFYTAKADDFDRIGSRHPTIKPIDLMQWLVRLVTPRGGTVLDCFAGSGTTGEAAYREGMSAVLIEREAEYCEDIRRRMQFVFAGPDERARESIKARGKVDMDPGPLFGGG